MSLRHIGILGGHSVYPIGTTADVNAFFHCLALIAPAANPAEARWADRLYRRYIATHELDLAQTWLHRVRTLFTQTACSSIDWSSLADTNTAPLTTDSRRPQLAAAFEPLFSGFDDAAASARSFLDNFKLDQPVRLVTSDMPAFMVDKKRPPAAYDALEGAPFWQR